MNELQTGAESVKTEDSSGNQKYHQLEKWEMHAVGDFLLKLYKRQTISRRNEYVSKQLIRDEFAKFLREPGNEHLEENFMELNGTADIGTLLYRAKYLIDTPRGSNNFRILSTNICKYRDLKLEECDRRRKNAIGDGNNDDVLTGNTDLNVQQEQACNEEHEKQFVSYEGSELQVRKTDFCQGTPGCCICQLNFQNEFQLKEHIAFHSEESNFKLMESLKKFDTSIFKISYKPCENSHILCFTLETRLPKVVIEKIILVQERNFHYLNDTRVPYNVVGGKDNFYINTNFFTEYLEQPIIIIFHTNSEDMRLMEQHHFVHFNPFPVVKMQLNPQLMPIEREFKTGELLLQYNPEADLFKAWKTNFPTEYLIKVPQFYNYIAENKKFNSENMFTVVSMLLQMEDLALRRANYLLIQREVNLRQTEEVYSLKLKNFRWFSGIADGRLQQLPKPEDEVLLLLENSETITVKTSSIFEMLLVNGLDNVLEFYKQSGKPFIGRIKRVVEGRVLFESNESIPLQKSFIAIIRPSRLSIRYQHRALQSLSSLPSSELKGFLFPQNVENPSVLPSTPLVLQYEGIRNDDEQLQAVRNIISYEKMMTPYIISGGPGTGKTAVIVESILQLYLRRPDIKILAVAGTDSACDEIALRLCKVLCKMHDSHAIARIYGYPCEQRREKIDELILEYSNLYANRHFIPAVDILHEFRILVCTAELIGHLSLGCFSKTADGKGVYTYIFLDDAAALTEPESLVALVNTLTPQSKLILAGDTQQLDPLLYSSRAKELGLNVSLMERLIASDCYKTDEGGKYNRSVFTKLVRNYRGHPKIVELCSRLYYDNKIVSAAPKETVSLYEKWHRIPNPKYPIILHNVYSNKGFDSSNNDSHFMGLYNLQEVNVVMNYIKDLMFNGVNERKIAQNDIGIISPHKEQTLRIQDELNLRGWYQIDVGLPEAFQGKEKSVVIISFVWTSENNSDILINKQRLNFMISRAKSLLILVGNLKVLSQNDDFKLLIEDCYKNNAVEGGNFYLPKPKLSKSLSHANSTDQLKDIADADGTDDDTLSQCSEISATGEKKKPKNRKRKKKSVNTITSNENEVNNSLKGNQDQKTQSSRSTSNSQTTPNQKGCEAQKLQTNKRKNDKKVDNTNASDKSNYEDDLLKNLPSVPREDNQTLNALKDIEADIMERVKKLNIKPMASNPSPVSDNANPKIIDKPSPTSPKPKANDNIAIQSVTPQQQLKMQQQIKHGNVAAGHNNIKRLNHNSQQFNGQQGSNNNKKGQRVNKKDNANVKEKNDPQKQKEQQKKESMPNAQQKGKSTGKVSQKQNQQKNQPNTQQQNVGQSFPKQQNANFKQNVSGNLRQQPNMHQHHFVQSRQPPMPYNQQQQPIPIQRQYQMYQHQQQIGHLPQQLMNMNPNMYTAPQMPQMPQMQPQRPASYPQQQFYQVQTPQQHKPSTPTRPVQNFFVQEQQKKQKQELGRKEEDKCIIA